MKFHNHQRHSYPAFKLIPRTVVSRHEHPVEMKRMAKRLAGYRSIEYLMSKGTSKSRQTIKRLHNRKTRYLKVEQ